MPHPGSHAGATLASTCPEMTGLLELPQEILDMIFNLAYPRVDKFQIITKSPWNAREIEWRKTMGASYQVQPFPTPKACEFLVSKEYFVNAARAYIGNQTFDERSTMSPQGYLVTPGKVHEGVAIQWMKDVVLRGWMLKYARLGPSIRKLTLHVDDRMFEDLEKFPWEVRLDDEDLRTVIACQGLDRMSNISSLTVKPSVPSYADTREKRKMFLDNAERFRDVAWRCVSRPDGYFSMSGAISSGKSQPLYHGSRVTYGSSYQRVRGRTRQSSSLSRRPSPFEKQCHRYSSTHEVIASVECHCYLCQYQSVEHFANHPMAGNAENVIDAIEATRRDGYASALDHPTTTLLQREALSHVSPNIVARTQNTDQAILQDADIPDDREKLRVLFETNMEGFAAWLKRVKDDRMQGIIS